MNLALVVLSHTTIFAHFTTGFRWLLYSLLPAVYCRPDRARLAYCIRNASSFLSHVFLFFFELGANSPLRRDAWLSVVLDKCCSSLLCLGFSLRGQPRAHGGCRFGWWAAYNKAGVLHMVCHSSVCSSLPMEIVCSAPSRVDLFFCHTMFIPSFWSDANVERVSWTHMLFVGYITFARSCS